MPKKNQLNNPIAEELVTEQEAEVMASRTDEPSSDFNIDEKAEMALTAEEGADADQAVPAELAAIHEDNESAVEVSEGKVAKKKAAKKAEPAKVKKTRSAKYKASHDQVEKGKQYSVSDALELIKKLSYAKFDAGVELHLHLSQKKSKGSTESTKGTFHLPHGSGKLKNIIVLTEAKIEEIAKTKKIDFDIALATPDLMPKVARIAKILGPKGKMPDPKSGTVTADPDKAIAEINSGRAEYRIDSSNNVHQLVGKVSWENQKLNENIDAVLGSMQKNRILDAYLTSTMSPSVTLDLSTLK